MKNRWCKILVPVLLVLLLFGCGGGFGAEGEAKVPNIEDYEVNKAIPCEQYNYDNSLYDNAINLTEIGEDDVMSYLGTQILSDYEAYKEILDSALARQYEDTPWISEKAQNAFSHGEITEADFEEYDFLMIDFMRYYAIRLYPRLENLTFEDGKVCVDLMYDAFIASTADNSGVLYFIPIPKGCTEAEVTPIYTSFAG